MTDQDYLFDVKVDAFSKVDDCSNETVGLTDIEIDVDGEVEGETEGQAKDESYNDSSSDTKGKLRIIPKLTLQEIQCLENEELHVDVPINLCSKARMWTKYGINGRFKYEFDMLFDYAAALRQADPNCNVDLMVVSRKKSPRIANLSPKSKTLTPEQQPNVPSKSPNFHVSKQKFEKKGNISTQRSSSTACSTREVTDMKGKGKAKEQPRTQPIRPNRKLHDADTKDGL
ncbi:hypothetical protein V6N12_047435 [Hibiscus sabdariffa]|uniref:Uncharacterized protein n=1 Tax=Hibiscus sabdariffa TaxID=183260 RepID=A0ABR2DAW4_9ROSI